MDSKKLVVQAPSVCLFLYPQLSFFVSTRLLGMCTTLNPARGLVIFGLGKSSRPTAAGAPGVAGLRVTLCSLKIPIKCHKWGPSKFLNLDKGELKPYSSIQYKFSDSPLGLHSENTDTQKLIFCYLAWSAPFLTPYKTRGKYLTFCKVFLKMWDYLTQA